MPAAPGGLVPRQALRPLCQARALPTHSLARTFSSAVALRAPAAPKTSAPKKANQTPKPLPFREARGAPTIALSPALLKNPLIVQLVRAQTPTLLYESASHTWMKISAWSATIACWSGAAINFYLSSATTVEGGLPWFITPVYTATSLALAGLGSFFLFGAANVIKSIRAVPSAAAAARGALPASINPAIVPIHLEIAIKPLLPFRSKPRVVAVGPAQVSIAGPLYEPAPTSHQLRDRAAADKKASKAKWEEDKKRLLTLPFRDAWRAAKLAFYGVKRALTGGGFVKLQVGDTKCKLDMATGWSLNNGRTLEGLVKMDAQGQRPGRR